MTTVEFLFAMKDRSKACTADLLLPVKTQEEDEEEQPPRAATIYLTGLPEMKKPEKKAPYVIHTVAEGKDRYTDRHDSYGGRDPTRHRVDTVEVRSVLCVYASDRQEGGLYLLELMERLRGMMDFLLPHFVEEGKSALVIAIGCTGGQHRSVAITRSLADFIRQKGYNASENHRDMTRA